MQLLDEQLATVTRPAKDNELPDAILTESGAEKSPRWMRRCRIGRRR
uniref:Transposase n=1 Tax=Klebsiella pneumoniae TaxID=573 RepID=A0A8B0SXG8_KLEPN|nr:Transposase [Klebsiella pneumoniae]